MFRPIRPKPLIPTLTDMLPPLNGYVCSPAWKGGKLRSRTNDARMCRAKSQRAGRNKLSEFLDLGYFSVDKRNKYSACGRIAVNPIFCVISVRVAGPHFLVRMAERRNYHVFIHPYYRLMVRNSLFEFRSQRIHPILGGRLLRKIEQRGKLLSQSGRGQRRQLSPVIQKQRASHPFARMRHAVRIGNISYADAQMLPQVEFFSATAVKLEQDALRLKIDLCDLNRIAGIRSRAPVKSHKILKVLNVQRLACRKLEGLFPSCERLESLRILAVQIPNQQKARLFPIVGGFARRGRGRRGGRTLCGLRGGCGRSLRLTVNVTRNSCGK